MKQLLIAIICTLSIFGRAVGNVSQSQQYITELKSQGIENAGNPKIRELYEKLNTQITELEQLEQKYMNDLRDNAQAMKDKEQSTENKLLGAAGIGATGIGGMQMASAMAEQNADADAERDMTAYLATFTCNYGNGKNVKYGETDVELPGGNELINLKTEYMALAADLKQRKILLDLTPGIESEEILDSATSGLYDDIAIGKTDGAFASLSDAILNPTGDDAAEMTAQKSDTAKKLKTGAITAGIGAVGSAIGNLVINKDAPQENSAKIKSDYESKKKKQESEISKTESQLDKAIADNKAQIKKYNDLLVQHNEFVKTITETDCITQFREYIDYINSLKPITDNFTDTSNLQIKYDLAEQKSAYKKCTDIATEKRKCESKPHHKWTTDGKCIDNTPAPTNGATDTKNNATNDTNDNITTTPVNTPTTGSDSDQCPAENPRMRSLTEENRVGDFCKYGNVAIGTVFKRDDGTCSCTATQCKPGYKLDGGMCEKCDTGYELKNGTCTPVTTIATELPEPKPVKYFAVCKKDKGKSGGTEYCIDEPFNWTNVQMLQATALAAEYALVKNGHNVVCENEWRESGNDDWFSCTSTDNKHFYEFKFDDVAESIDIDIQSDLRHALCEALYDGEFNKTKTFVYDPDCELSDASKRESLKRSAEKFGISATIGNSGVNFSHSQKTSYTTQKIKGIDPFAFYSGDIQIRANGQMIDAIFEYAALQLAPRDIKTFTCNRNPFQVTSQIDDRKTKGTSDDVLTCYIDGTAVDFVFDDMSELSKKLSRGGYSNMNCVSVDGTYNGYECMYVGETQCKRIQKLSAATMPANKLPFWDDVHQECQLPAAADATEYQRNINMGVMIGGVIVGVVVTVATGGTAAPALALLAAETVGGVIEIAATQKIYNAIDEFLENSQKCKNSTCAESMLRDNLQRMSNMTFDMTDAQINGIDAELARLANLIPTNSDFYQKIAENGTSTADNSLGFFDADSWEPEQVWRAVGITLQLASLITGIGKWIAGKVNKLPRATRAIAQNAAKNADSTIKMTATQAKRLDEIDARLTRIQAELDANPSASRAAELHTERTRLTQEKNTILNKVGTKDTDEIANAKSAAYSAKEIADAQRELDDARNALQKRLDWESKQSPGALKNDLQSRNSAGRTARDKVRAAEQKLRDMGETVTPMEFRSVDDILGNAADNTTNAGRAADKNSPNASNATTQGARNLTKAEKIDQARRTGNLGYHGTDADIAMDDMIRPSANSSDNLGNIGYGIAESKSTAQTYAIKRLIERQNIGKNISFSLDLDEGGVLIIKSDEPLDLSNKTAYIYTTAKRSDMKWTKMGNGYAGDFNAAQMPEAVEILSKESVNLDDLIKRGKVKIDTPNATDNISNTATRAPNIHTPNATNPINNFLSHSSTLQDLNSQGRLTLTTSSTLNGKQYLRISMGNNPDLQETQALIQKLQNEGFYVSSNSTRSGEKFIGVSHENIFTPWNKHSGNWAFNKVDDSSEIMAEIVPEVVFDARKMRVSDGSGKLYVRNSASEMLGHRVNSEYAVSEVDQLYVTIRRGIEYPVNNTNVSKAINAMEKPNNDAILYSAPSPSYNWHVHSYNGPRGTSAEVQYHVSLNVDVDDTLIKKLDDIIAKDQGRHIVDFKIPPVGNRWKTMADPISIYMRNTSPEIERAIAEAAKSHVRTSSEIGLLGRKIDDGVAIAYETSAARMDIVEDIINQVARKDAGVAEQLRANGRYSVGNTEALRLWASDFLGYTIAPATP